MAICIVMWWLSAYPRVRAAGRSADAPRAGRGQPAGDAQSASCSAGRPTSRRRPQQAGSFAGRFGHLVQPVFAPLGFDWQLTVGILTSFLAREVFVSTMSVLRGRQRRYRRGRRRGVAHPQR